MFTLRGAFKKFDLYSEKHYLLRYIFYLILTEESKMQNNFRLLIFSVTMFFMIAPGTFATDTICQSLDFKCKESKGQWVKCTSSQNECVYLLVERYEGVRSCCVSNECPEEYPYFDPGPWWNRIGWLERYFAAGHEQFCGSEDENDYPVDIYIYGDDDTCGQTNPVLPKRIIGPPVFCGSCDEGEEEEVIVKFSVMFNPTIISSYPDKDKYDYHDPAVCWEDICANYDALVFDEVKEFCDPYDPGCRPL